MLTSPALAADGPLGALIPTGCVFPVGPYAGPSREGLMRSYNSVSVAEAVCKVLPDYVTYAWWGWIVRSIRSVESLGAFRSPRRVWRGFVVLGFFRSLRRPIGALSHCLWSIRRRIITLALLLTFGITLLGLDIWRIICDLHNGYLWICAGNLFLLLTFGCLHSQLDMSSFLVLETLSIRLG